MTQETTAIRINEHGDETHESWLLVGANRLQTSPGARLFDSEITHQHFVSVTVARCSRRRELNRDWLYSTERLVKFDLSQAQWGAFVSSFGQGNGGVPATLSFFGGPVPQAPAESRFDQSHDEVRRAGETAITKLRERYADVMTAFEGGGKRPLREALRSMGIALDNTPANMEFAAKSLTEHVENVVTKARADIEGMAQAAARRSELTEGQDARQIEGGQV